MKLSNKESVSTMDLNQIWIFIYKIYFWGGLGVLHSLVIIQMLLQLNLSSIINFRSEPDLKKFKPWGDSNFSWIQNLLHFAKFVHTWCHLWHRPFVQRISYYLKSIVSLKIWYLPMSIDHTNQNHPERARTLYIHSSLN